MSLVLRSRGVWSWQAEILWRQAKGTNKFKTIKLYDIKISWKNVYNGRCHQRRKTQQHHGQTRCFGLRNGTEVLSFGPRNDFVFFIAAVYSFRGIDIKIHQTMWSWNDFWRNCNLFNVILTSLCYIAAASSETLLTIRCRGQWKPIKTALNCFILTTLSFNFFNK